MEVAGVEIAFVPGGEDMDFGMTQTNPEVVAAGTNNLSVEPHSVPPSQWTSIPDLSFSQAAPDGPR